MNFLEALNPAERQAFISVAQERTFLRGARIMQEGEPANYVIVILGGWTQISVHENGSEWVIAERGPGHLVGERAALQVNIRSANVIALGPVRALVMRTEDFASFIDAHPRVLKIIEGQIYDRLAEMPRNGRAGLLTRHLPEPAGLPPQPLRHPQIEGARLRPLSGENCTVLLTDVVGFGAVYRNDRDRQIIRAASEKMIQESLGRVWGESISEDRGDGLLIIVRPHIPTASVMALLHRALPGELRRHNRTSSDHTNIRLRVAVNVGPVTSDGRGLSGEAIIRTARLIEAPVLKEAMAETGAMLGIIASEFVYETAIRHDPEAIDVNGYRLVEVNIKETKIAGWMQLSDPSPPEKRLSDPLRSPEWRGAAWARG
jgi:class 3 adenylate cyclase